MSITSGFYDSKNHDRLYSTIQMGSIFDGIITDGVYASVGNKLMVKADHDMNLLVQSGRAWFSHSWFLNDADYPIVVEAAEAVLDRIDTVVLEINRSEGVRDGRVYVLKGVPSSVPAPRELTNNQQITQVSLADIYVKAGTTALSQSEITNNVGTIKCPFVTGVLSTVTTDELISQWEARFESMFSELQTRIDQLVQGSIPDGAVSSTYKAVLSKNGWIEGDDDAYQTISILGLKVTDDPAVDADMEGKTVAESMAIDDEWSYYKGTTANGSLTVRFRQKPSIDIPIKLKCVRK